MTIMILSIAAVLVLGWLITGEHGTGVQAEPYYFIIPTDDELFLTGGKRGKLEGVLNFERGYGNGYVAVFPGHPFYGKNYMETDDEGNFVLNDLDSLSVHGGVTFTGRSKKGRKDAWLIGFDTAHYEDNKENCNVDYLHKECQSLLEQINTAALKN